MLDGYCRHMGGDLSQGTIKGDEVACPFHDWRWGANGRCKKIPYARRVPPVAKTRSWKVLDRTACCSSGTIPRAIPRRPTSPSPASRAHSATSGRIGSGTGSTVDTNCREVVDNIVDMAHFFYVHYSFPTYFKNVFEGHVASQFMRGQAREDMRPHAAGQPRMLGKPLGRNLFRPVLHDRRPGRTSTRTTTSSPC